MDVDRHNKNTGGLHSYIYQSNFTQIFVRQEVKVLPPYGLGEDFSYTDCSWIKWKTVLNGSARRPLYGCRRVK